MDPAKLGRPSEIVVLFASLLLASPPATADTWPPGQSFPDALVADVTPEGFDAIALVIPSLLPSGIDIPSFEQGGGELWGAYAYYISLSGAQAGIQVTAADIQPGNGVLNISADLLVNINSASSPFNMQYELLYTGTNDCPGYVDPFPVSIDTTMGLAVVDNGDGTRSLDATVGEISVTYDLQGDDIHLDCFIGDVEDVLDSIGLSLYDLLIGQLDSMLQEQIGAFGPEIESVIEEAFASASIQQELDLNGTTATISLQPSAVEINPSGVRLALEGSVTSTPNACVAAYDPGGSLKTSSSPPDIGAPPDGVFDPFHVGADVSDDFANSTLYSLWRAGLLCYTVGDELGIALDTGLMGALTGDVFTDLFPESKPVSLRIVPRGVPEVQYDGEHDVGLVIRDLDLEFYAELDGRESRIVAIALNGPVGIDLVFDGATGALGINLALNPEELNPTVSYNEHKPGQDEAVVADFGSGLSGILDVALGSLLGDLAFALPSIYGVGVQELVVAPAGNNGDWLGIYTRVGSVTYTSGKDGCGGCGSSKGSSCGGGCTTSGGLPPELLGALSMFAAVFLRRRSG